MNMDEKQRYKKIKDTLILVLLLNWLVAFIKIIYGLVTRCISILADGFHSLSDGTSNIIGLVGIKVASQPSDKNHPYGHKKYETLFSLVIAFLLFIVSFNLFKKGIERLIKPVIPSIDIASFIIMVVTLIINIVVMLYEYKMGRDLNSDILIADSMHTRTDILTSLSVIVALVGIKLGIPMLDPIVTFIISFLISYAGLEIIKYGSAILCDTAAIVDVNRISDIVLKIKGVKTCHKIRTRGRPDDIHIDLHVQVSPDMHIDKAHQISYSIENEIKKNIPQVTDVVVHMEPKIKEKSKV